MVLSSKVLKLGLLRLEDLCDRLDFDDNNNDRKRSDILTQVSTPPPRLCIVFKFTTTSTLQLLGAL